MSEEHHIDKILEPYRIALEIERKGKELFEYAAKSTKSDLARQTFQFLAKEEIKHIKHIEKFYNTLEKSGGKVFEFDIESDAEQKLEDFNNKLESIKDSYQSTETDIEAYQMALDLENNAEDFYKEMIKKAENPQQKKFYEWLITEEAMHSRLINSCLKFVQDPIKWFKTRRG